MSENEDALGLSLDAHVLAVTCVRKQLYNPLAEGSHCLAYVAEQSHPEKRLLQAYFRNVTMLFFSLPLYPLRDPLSLPKRRGQQVERKDATWEKQCWSRLRQRQH